MNNQSDKNTLATGLLDVGKGHQIYWEDWGNPKATPIFYCHGGPGGGCGESNKLLYDPSLHRVIFHDQRGSGRSLPFAETKHNTTQDLIADIEKLRCHLKIEKMHVHGGSWGSALALFYAVAHPDRVQKIIIWSVFLGRQFEVDFVNEGYPKHFFPEAWERFIALVPKKHRSTGNSVMQYYNAMFYSDDLAIAKKYADEWTLWEATLLSISYNKERLEAEILGDDNNGAIAKLEAHYFLNGCFVPENYILDNIAKIQSIPCAIIHGRFDMCTPPSSANDLFSAYGKNATFQWVNSGHRRTDPEMFTALKATVNAMFS